MALRGVTWTLTQIRSDLRTRVDDATDTRWSEAQKNLAINAAVRRARPRWWEERIDDSNTYDENTFRYTLPPGCESVQAAYFEPTTTGNPRKLISPARYHLEGNEFVFENDNPTYDGQTLYIIYLVYQTNLLEIGVADGVIAAGALTALSSLTADFSTNNVQEGDIVEISGDGTYYVESVDSATQITLHKAATAGTGLTFYVARYTDMPYEYLINGSMAELYEMASRNRPGVEVEENIRWATYYRQVADVEMARQYRHPRPYRRY